MKTTTPPVTHEKQRQSDLCWATCIRMALSVKGHPGYRDMTPQSIADRTVYGKGFNQAMRDEIIKSAAENYGFRPTLKKAKISFADIKAQIDNSRLVIAGVSWPNGGGHVLVIDGYEETAATSGKPATQVLHVADPAMDSAANVPFETLDGAKYGATGGGQGGVWDGTILLNW